MPSEKIIGAVLCMVLAMISITTGASLAKTIFPIIGAEATTSLRLTFAAIILCIIFKPWRHLPASKDIKTIIFYGASLGLMNLFFYMAIAHIPLGIALALEFTGPLALALFNSRNHRDLIWVLCAIIGILLLLPITKTTASLEFTGIAFALLAGVFWAFYIIAGKKVGKNSHGGTIVALGMAVSAMIVSPTLLLTEKPIILTSHILLLGISIAILSSAIPYSLEMVALKRLSSKTFSILTSLEPAIGAFSGFIFLHEKLSSIHLLAIGLIILASAGSTFFENKKSSVTELPN